MPARMSAWAMPGQLTRMQMRNAGAMLGEQHVGDLRRRADREAVDGEAAELLLGRGLRVERQPLQPPREIGFVFLDEVRGDAAEGGLLVGPAARPRAAGRCAGWAAAWPPARPRCRSPSAWRAGPASGSAPPASRRRYSPLA